MAEDRVPPSSTTTPPSEHDRRLHELLAEAIEQPASEREAYLAGVCPDPALRAEVLALLGGEEELGGFLERPLLAVTATRETASPPIGAVAASSAGSALAAGDDGSAMAAIGPYQPLALLGEGGMGRVYLAEQVAPVRRRVALKVMRSSLADAAAQARFDAERQAMARLAHPNVGRILEAGTTPAGAPFFVMEWIDGAPITTYCDQRRLDLRSRLPLFVEVCRAVQHAHQKQVLHRDLKPTNVLVTEIDGRATPKIIDFGIATALDQPRADADRDGGRLAGTVDYMSPEALRPGEGADVDTRSDVFSLGVLLYELLAGVRPYATSGDGLIAVYERLARGAAPPPSTRVAALDRDTADRLAGLRAEPGGRRLGRRLRGDLDAIVAKAIAVDREARYGSAGELADDLERSLAHEPVTARPADRRYLLARFARRHRTALGVGAALLLLLLGGLAGTLAGLRAARQEATAAARARDEAEQVADFLASLFRESGPLALHQRAPTPADVAAARAILDRGARRIEQELGERPLVRARLETVIGTVYAQLALYDEATHHLATALALRRAELPPDHLELAASHEALGRLRLERGEADAAASELEKARAILEQHGAAAPPEQLAAVLGDLGRLARLRGRLGEAEQLLARALAIHEQARGPADPELAGALNDLASLHLAQSRPDLAEPLYARALALQREHLRSGDPRMLQTLNNLAAAIASQGRLDEAAPLFAEVLAARRTLLGDQHPDVAESLANLGMLRLNLGQPADAEPLLREALAIREQAFGDSHPLVATSLASLGAARAADGDVGEAEALLRRALAAREDSLGPDHLDVARIATALADLLESTGRATEARDLRTRALAIREAAATQR